MRDCNDVVHAHGNAVTADAAAPLHMIQYIRKQRHKYIGAWQTADILNKLPDEHNNHVGGEQPAHRAADSVQNKSHQGYIPLAEFFCQRPHGKNADAHGNAADHRNQGLGNAVVVGTKHIVAEIDEAQIFDAGAEGVDQEIGIDDEHIAIRENRLELSPEWNGSFFCALIFQRDPLLGEEVFQQGQRQRQNRQHAHQDDPLALVCADGRHDDHGEYQRHQNTAHHDGGNLVEYR